MRQECRTMVETKRAMLSKGVLAVAVAVMAAGAFAADVTWQDGVDGNWAVPGNWGGSVPGRDRSALEGGMERQPPRHALHPRHGDDHSVGRMWKRSADESLSGADRVRFAPCAH